MGDAAGHLAEGAQALLLHHRLLGLAQFIVGGLQFLARTGLGEERAALLLGGEDLKLQFAFLRINGFDLLQDLPVDVARLFQDQYDHADRDEELQHRGEENFGVDQGSEPLREGVADQVHSP